MKSIVRISKITIDGINSYMVKNDTLERGQKLLAVFHDSDGSGQALLDAIDYGSNVMKTERKMNATH